MESFQELELPEFLRQSLKQMNFVKPTPVQAQAIPPGLSGKDIVASAQTGTGKTAAFGVPLLAYLFANPDKTALVLTPTRELAVQVQGVLRHLSGPQSNWGSVLLIGGSNMNTQFQILSRKPRLVIGTPGRVIDHLNRNSLDLSRTGFLVLDEADRMLDMGFAPQLEEIRKRLTAPRQTLLFSATFPKNIQEMASQYLKDPVRITVGPVSQPVPKVAQQVLYTTETRKPEELLNELKTREGSVLVFVRTQHRVDRVARRLKEAGVKATLLHGGRTQGQRKQAIDHFREGHYRVLVATDIAARGLDIHHIAHVINYDLPRNPEDYIHRVGRTARAGAEGSSLSFITPEDQELWRDILKLMGPGQDPIQAKPSMTGAVAPPAAAPRPQGRPPERGRSHQPQRGRSFGRPKPQGQTPPSQPPASAGASAPRPDNRQGQPPFERHSRPQQGRRPGQGGAFERRENRFQKNRPDGRHGQRDRYRSNERHQDQRFVFHGKEGSRHSDQPNRPEVEVDGNRAIPGHNPHERTSLGFLERIANQFKRKDKPADRSFREERRPFREDHRHEGGHRHHPQDGRRQGRFDENRGNRREDGGNRRDFRSNNGRDRGNHGNQREGGHRQGFQQDHRGGGRHQGRSQRPGSF